MQGEPTQADAHERAESLLDRARIHGGCAAIYHTPTSGHVIADAETQWCAAWLVFQAGLFSGESTTDAQHEALMRLIGVHRFAFFTERVKLTQGDEPQFLGG